MDERDLYFRIERVDARYIRAIGDDRLQMKSRGVVVPESFTHGTSKQRARWFTQGLKTGDMKQGDTFGVSYDRL